ncbi:LysR substrate-binding domain-containing protein [Paenibacillus chondroitinus]|uniref:LysR substrate-binding domain-containing protein n=1 Tax=Paenibacillus chondroitinus TaxID=59842 RepID=A0ABU6D765_9BACL|nr:MULTISPECIES: LysR substrate-binding domain-containing protein [Paenibacillus]MCY9661900.1 LysR substrate-binding domain-containing protein [Paenibacillus anseongense]MEB4793586.1 LysR substrate-binding domain-containing protein [Paenibacillus chondroitinus]
MDYRLLAYFLAVCEELHFTKAAEKLGISQPTLSQQIRILEQRIGSPLFQRIGKKVYVTEAGEILLKHSRNIFHELEQAQAAFNEIQGMQRGRLRIGCSGNHLLTATIMAFHAEYPKIELSVAELATEETIEGLLNNQLDLGVVFLPDEDEQLVRIPLYKEKLLLVVSKDHPLSDAEAIRLEDLVQLPVAMLPKKFYVRHMIEACCEQSDLLCKPVLELSTLESLLQMAKNHVCGAVLPGSYVEGIQSSEIRCIPIMDPVPQKDVGIVYRKDMFLCQTTKTFMKQVTQQFLSESKDVTS